MTADSFYTVLASILLLNIQKYLRERERESDTSNKTRTCKLHLVFRNIKLHSDAKTVQIEFTVIVEVATTNMKMVY